MGRATVTKPGLELGRDVESVMETMQNYWGVGSDEQRQRKKRKSKPKYLPLKTKAGNNTINRKENRGIPSFLKIKKY